MLFDVQKRNKRGDLIAVFSSPMTTEKWNALQFMVKQSKRFEILLPNGYRIKFGQHKRILITKPKNFGAYVRTATLLYKDSEGSGEK